MMLSKNDNDSNALAFASENENKRRSSEKINGTPSKKRDANFSSHYFSGIELKLPKEMELYGTQKLMASKIIKTMKEAAEKVKYALIESPTGTGYRLKLITINENKNKGKTIILLASTTSYAKHYNKIRTDECPLHNKDSFEEIQNECNESMNTTSGFYNEENVDENVDSDKENERSKPKCMCKKPIKIYYAVRTHSLIKQVVEESKKLPYIKHTILASREIMCINEQIKNGFGKSVTNGCKDLFNTTNGCSMKNNLESDWNARKIRELINDKIGQHSFDLENLIDSLKSESCCPYYASTRTLSQDANIIFCPYSYLLNPMIRNSSGINLDNAIVILDEAHNIESACIDAGSFEFTESELMQHIEHMQERSSSVQSIKNIASIRKNTENGIQKNKENKSNGETMEKILSEFKESYEKVLNFYIQMHKLIRKLAEQKTNNDDFTIGSELLHENINENIDMGKEHLDNLKKSLKILASKNNSLPGKFSIKKLRPLHASVFLAQKFLLFLQYYKKEGSKNLYRCNIQFENKMFKKIKQEVLIPREDEDFKKVKVHLICMTAQLCFEDSFNACHSVILASGTLCPTNCLKSELGITEANEMEGNQVVTSDRIFSAAIQFGPNNKSLLCTQNGMQELQCTMELAQTIIEICLIVPSGIICFLPNYDAIDKINKSLMECSKWEELRKQKKVLKEPRNGSELNCILASYKEAIYQPDLYSPDCTGSLLLSVFRGKFSEGIDFKDELARAVICIGIPLPNIMNYFVKEKMQFNNDLCKTNGSTILSGNEWYRTQAFRALNQSLGRAIRHKMDWAALFLVDIRFAQCLEPKHADFGKISKWIRNSTKSYKNFTDVKKELAEFVKKMN